MKRVKVLVPFRDVETGKLHNMDDEITVSDERLEAIRTVHKNLVQVLGDVEPDEADAGEEEVAPVQPRKKK